MRVTQGAIDRNYFLEKLRASDKSVRGLARHLNIDASAASRMLSGQRKMKMEEANEIARFLNAPVSEVLRHAGISFNDDNVSDKILLVATVAENGTVQRLLDPKPLPPDIIERARAAIDIYSDGKVLAAQVRATKGMLSICDDAVLLFRHTDHVDTTAIGSLAVCRLREGEQLFARIERARKTGEARIMTADGKVKEVQLQTATPVLAIIP
jgi:transcriptional regulator with XRE-family HTH domain